VILYGDIEGPFQQERLESFRLEEIVVIISFSSIPYSLLRTFLMYGPPGSRKYKELNESIQSVGIDGSGEFGI